jgi:aminoglycoside N3'-acetyltransferase
MTRPTNSSAAAPIEQIADQIRRLGVGAGQAVMVHASLRAIGPVVGGADGVLDALESVVGPSGGLMMVLGARNDWDWVNERDPDEREALLRTAEAFDPDVTPADPEVGVLAEVFRRRAGTQVTDHPEGRFGARGGLAPRLLRDPPWDDYFGEGSPLQHLCDLDGGVLRLGADPDTTTLMHLAEYLTPLPQKRRVERHRVCRINGQRTIRTISSLDDSEGIVDWPGEDYFQTILTDYLNAGRGVQGRVGGADSHYLPARDLLVFAVQWMTERFAGLAA